MTDDFDLDIEARERLRRLMGAPVSRVAVASPWVERARAHTLPHKVYADTQTDARVVRETPDDVLRRTMPRPVGPDDSGMLTFGYSASYEDGQPRAASPYCPHCGPDCGLGCPLNDEPSEREYWLDLGGEG